MTELETREKICEIISPYVSAWGDDTAIANALIAAGGIVYKSDYASMKETAVRYKAEVSKAGARAKEAEHRAQVAENELKLYKLAVKIWQERYSDIRCFNFNIALRQAEKELAEEGEDD